MDDESLRNLVRADLDRRSLPQEAVEIARQIAEQHGTLKMTTLVRLVIEELTAQKTEQPK